MVVIAKIMIAADRDRDLLRFDLPVRRSTCTRTVPFDTTHVAKGQGPRAVAVGGAAQVDRRGAAWLGSAGGSAARLGAARCSVGDLG